MQGNAGLTGGPRFKLKNKLFTPKPPLGHSLPCRGPQVMLATQHAAQGKGVKGSCLALVQVHKLASHVSHSQYSCES